MNHKKRNLPAQEKEFEEKVIRVSRVSKKTKGGNQIGFSVLMVVGDRKGQVGVGLGKSGDVVTSIKKGIKKAKKKMIQIPLDGSTIPFAITVKKGAGKVLLKPAAKGSGVIAGGPVRSVVEAAGIRDISAKILGSDNQASSVYATFEALKQIAQIVKVRGIKLKSIADVEAAEREKVRQKQEKAKKNIVPVSHKVQGTPEKQKKIIKAKAPAKKLFRAQSKKTIKAKAPVKKTAKK
jgi:small subunit ribosomal protein S5